MSRKVKELLESHGTPQKEIYFDLENSGFIPDEVVEAMMPYFNKKGFGHPSITHRIGWESLEIVYETKELIAKTLGIRNPENIVFTHSGTEANNLAILGFLLKNRDKGKGKKVVVSAIEHLSVIFPARFASELFGFKVVLVPADKWISKYRPKLYVIDLRPLIPRIALYVKEDHMVILLRRAMMRIASRFARKIGAKALATGESLGQVASQTLHNLYRFSLH